MRWNVVLAAVVALAAAAVLVSTEAPIEDPVWWYTNSTPPKLSIDGPGGPLDAIGVVVVYDATTLLDPNWLTTAVYRLLTHADVAKANGEFAYHDLGKLLTGLTPERYPPSRWPFSRRNTL